MATRISFFTSTFTAEVDITTSSFTDALSQLNAQTSNNFNTSNSVFTDLDTMVSYTDISAFSKPVVEIAISPLQSKAGLDRSEIQAYLNENPGKKQEFAAYCKDNYGRHYTNLANSSLIQAFSAFVTPSFGEVDTEDTPVNSFKACLAVLEHTYGTLEALGEGEYDEDDFLGALDMLNDAISAFQDLDIALVENTPIPENIQEKIAFINKNHPYTRK